MPFVIIERDPERMQQAIDAGFLAVEADASSEQVLKRVRIERARGFIAAVGTDAENVYAVLTARLLRPDLYIIGRAETEDAKDEAGARRRRPGRVSPYQIGGLQLAQTALRPAVVDFVQIATSSENLELNMEQVRDRRRRRWRDARSSNANLRQRFGVVVVGIQRSDGRMEFNPPPDAVMRAAITWSCSATRTSCTSSRTAAGEPPPAVMSVDAGARARRTLGRRGDPRRGVPGCAAFTAAAGRPPGLGIVLVGEDPASEIYVRNKVKAGRIGLRVDLRRLPATATLDELLALVAS